MRECQIYLCECPQHIDVHVHKTEISNWMSYQNDCGKKEINMTTK